MEPFEFDMHEQPVRVALDTARTAESAAYARDVVEGEDSDPDFAGFEYWEVTWAAETAGHVYWVPGRAKRAMERGMWSYSDRVGNAKGGFIDAEEAARELASRYGYFRMSGWVYRKLGGWTGWRTHKVDRWFVTGDDSKRVMTQSRSELDRLTAQWEAPRVEAFKVDVSCVADKAPGAGPCAYCEKDGD